MTRIGTLILTLLAIQNANAADPPKIIEEGPTSRPVQLPDGSFRAFFSRFGKLHSVSSKDGRSWQKPKVVFNLPHRNMGGGLSLLDAKGELHVILTHGRGSGRPAVTRFIDLWHCRTFDGRKRWGKPHRIWEGYCGAVMDVKQLKNGRIVVPFAAWKKPGETVAPSTGSNYTTVVTSDDEGRSWKLSKSKLTAPCKPGYNGNNYGAIEPTMLQFKDGRVWMLMRAQTGFLYESFSKDGINWSAAKPSQFHSSTSPAALMRLPDKRIVVVWNNCEQPQRHNKAGVYGGRDALHAAISSDEGKTWHGFREIYRDPHRNETPPKRGDRGTAYPVGIATRDGRLLISSGQGGRRRLLLVDPDWLLETKQSESFNDGLKTWHVWKPFGPASRYWRDRTTGPRLIGHHAKNGAKALHVRGSDKNDPDCAIWNFPAGTQETLQIRILIPKGSNGASISLTNRFFNPVDHRAEKESPVRFQVAVGEKPGVWRTLKITWDYSTKQWSAVLGGKIVARKKLGKPPFGGLSYLRIRSASTGTDPVGVLIDSVRVETSRR